MISLNRLEEKDIPLVQKYASDPEIGKLSNVPSPYPENGAETWYNHVVSLQNIGCSKVFTIVYNNEFAGIISLNEIVKSEHKANIDYWVRSDLHSKGIGTFAVKCVINHAKQLGLKNFYSGCLRRNVGSKKVLLKNGFNVIQQFTLTEGKHHGEDMLLFSNIELK